MFKIYTDSDCDVDLSLAEEMGYKLISMPYIIDDKVFYPYKTKEPFDYSNFYNVLRKGVIPKTSAISPLEYVNYFEEDFKNGYDVLYVHFSKAMSGTFNALNLAIEELNEKYPDRKLYTIDTKGISIGALNIVKEVADLYKNGASIEEILHWAEKEVDHFAVYFYAEDLQFFHKSGRVSGIAAFMGGLIGIHPIIHMNSDGIMKSLSKGRGKVQTLKKIVSYVEELEENIKDHRVIIAHSDNLVAANLLAEMLEEKFGKDLKIEFTYVNPTTGSHCGPGSVGVSFHAKGR